MAGGTAVRTEMGVWDLDPAHSSVEFSVKHMMMTTVRGRFKDVTATLTGNEDHPEGCCVEVALATASVDTGSPDRDAHLRSADFFDAERYPKITFTSTRLEGDPRGEDGARFRVFGDLTIRGTTKEITLPVTHLGKAKDPWGNEKVGFEAEMTVNRKDYGLNWNAALETGGFLVGDDVKVNLSIQAAAA